MSNQQHRYDVYIDTAKKGYRQVPFTVVADWIQQSRLAPGDRVRLTGATQWRFLRDAEEFSPYLPQAPTLKADDMAEALDSVDLGYEFRRGAIEEEEDPDMIPLIDISLVLLVFFMMTAASNLVSTAPVETPAAEFANVMQPEKTLMIGLARVDNELRYYLGERQLPEDALIEEVAARVNQGGVSEAVVKADMHISFETVQNLMLRLEKANVPRIEAGVRDRGQKEAAP